MTFAQIFSKVDMWLGYLLTIISIISFVIALIKAIKAKQYEKVKGLITGLIAEAEKLTSKNGDPVNGSVKKSVVLAQVQTICSNMHYKYDEKVWSAVIDEYVNLTIKVNQREQDKAKVIQEEKKENANISVAKEV